MAIIYTSQPYFFKYSNVMLDTLSPMYIAVSF